MNGLDNPIVFYPVAVLMILFGILTIKFRNIFYSLLSAIVVFFIAGMFFYVLGSEYNAVIQIAIYGIAVPIILGIAIMFTNLKNPDKNNNKKSILKYLMFLTGGIFILAFIYLILTSFAVVPVGFNVSEQIGGTTLSTITAISSGLFIRYVWAFELISILLTIIVVGLVCLNKEVKSECVEENANE